MRKIVEKINTIPNLYHLSGSSDQQVKEAQNALALNFPEEYIDYVSKFGAISFYATEWTGLNIKGRLNVVEATKQERALNPDFPSDCFVLENQGINGILTVADEKGRIFNVQYDKKDFLCDSLSAYLDICMARKK